MEDAPRWEVVLHAVGRGLFGTWRRCIATAITVFVLALMVSPSLRHWFIHGIVEPAVALLTVIGFMLLIFRVAVKGKVGKITK
jgi:hypothetical protein